MKETPTGLDNSRTFSQNWIGFEAHHVSEHHMKLQLDTIQDS